MVVAFLLPLWIAPFVPTQDGPPLLANALILRDYGTPGTRFHEVYTISWEPIPNWTSVALLAGLSCLVPPLIAEKLLVSLYVCGFAAGYRYFVNSLANSPGWLTLVGFLLAFHRCFWLGFYNFSLSLVLLWITLGYFQRRVAGWSPRHAPVLCLLFLSAYFTHLVGFLFSALACLWLAAWSSPRRLLGLLYVSLALAPAACLALLFFQSADYFSPSGFGAL